MLLMHNYCLAGRMLMADVEIDWKKAKSAIKMRMSSLEYRNGIQ